jgi:hypothetical protein
MRTVDTYNEVIHEERKKSGIIVRKMSVDGYASLMVRYQAKITIFFSVWYCVNQQCKNRYLYIDKQAHCSIFDFDV